MVRRLLAPILTTSPFRSLRPARPGKLLAAALVALLAMPMVARAETVMVLGVIVNDKQERVGGALVRLYTTSTKMGRALAEDRSSTFGVFMLYRTNIAGDLGDLYIVYEGETGTAEPMRVSLKPADGGVTQARTADMVVLTVTAERRLTNDEAATRIAAIGQTQAILVQAGVRDAKTANEAVQLRTRQVVAAAPNLTGRDVELVERKVNDRLKVLPFKSDFSKGIRVGMEPKTKDPKGPV
jgi:hypothetical protein